MPDRSVTAESTGFELARGKSAPVSISSENVRLRSIPDGRAKVAGDAAGKAQ